MRALALHGSNQTGEVLRTRLDPIIKATSSKTDCEVAWDFPDGPVELERLEGDAVPKRAWYRNTAEASSQSLPLKDAYLSQFQVLLGFSQGGILAVACALKCESIRLIIAAGAPDADWIEQYVKSTTAGRSRYLRIVLLAGDKDEIVPKESTWRLAERLRKLKGLDILVETFSGNHFFPVTSRNCDEYARHIKSLKFIAGTQESAQAQRDEFDILQSIYQDNLTLDIPSPTSISDACLQVTIAVSPDVRLEFRPTFGYPAMGSLTVKIHVHDLKVRRVLERVISEAQLPLKGEMQIFACTAAAQDSLLYIAELDGNPQQNTMVEDEATELDAEDVPKEEEPDEQATIGIISQVTEEARRKVLSVKGSAEEDVDTRQGQWLPFCIGLLGKPSAGKSSFFNACTRHALEGKREAEVGAAPFTTIDPNFGQAYCQLQDGFRLPLLIKDVAGLVPGAYRGLGKGNRFLNDLLDASALLHICDGTGSADEGGRTLGEELGDAGQVSKDALWVLREVHLWIYGNITSKWPQRKKGRGHNSKQAESQKTVTNRVCQLFAGYHASPSITMRAARLAELDLEKAPEFTPQQRHRLCAFFIAVRFPVVLVLNKCDSFVRLGNKSMSEMYAPVLTESIKIMQSADLVCPASARLENALLSALIAKDIAQYDSASGSIVLPPKPNLHVQQHVGVLQVLGGRTGVHEALVRAVVSAKPIVVTAIVGSGNTQEDHRFLMYPGSNVYDLYETCLRNNIVSGDFVRAEEPEKQGSGCGARALSRDALLRHHPCVRIATNKRVVHQNKAAGTKH